MKIAALLYVDLLKERREYLNTIVEFHVAFDSRLSEHEYLYLSELIILLLTLESMNSSMFSRALFICVLDLCFIFVKLIESEDFGRSQFSK